jgi:hypothetical protein
MPVELASSRSSLPSTLTPTPTSPSASSQDGWNSIDVFCGCTDHVVSLLPKDQTWFSQARQEEAALKMLSRGLSDGEKHEGGFLLIWPPMMPLAFPMRVFWNAIVIGRFFALNPSPLVGTV